MNNQRKHERRESDRFCEENLPKEMNRAHIECEKECVQIRHRVKELESLLAECGGTLLNFSHDNELIADLINRIDALLPDTEG
jgi:hypothetical protein